MSGVPPGPSPTGGRWCASPGAGGRTEGGAAQSRICPPVVRHDFARATHEGALRFARHASCAQQPSCVQGEETTMQAIRRRAFLATAAGALTALTAGGILAAPLAAAGGLSSPPLVSATQWTDASAAAGTGQSGLDAVSCSTSSRCVAVGSEAQSTGGQVFAEEWNGSVWSPIGNLSVPTGAADNLTGVSCVGAVFCIAVGGDAASAISFVWNQNGSAFVQTSVPVPPGRDLLISQLGVVRLHR